MSGWWPDGDPRWDDDRATVPYGPSRVTLERPAPRPPWWRRVGPKVLGGLLGIALLAAIVGGLRARSGRAPRHIECVPAPTSDVAPDPEVQRLTVERDGCTVGATYDRASAILEIDGTTGFRVGVPDDWLLVGDWDCDGNPTPALYRPTTGVVFHFDRWATDDVVPSAAPRPTGVTDGIPSVSRSDGCDEVAVAPGGSDARG